MNNSAIPLDIKGDFLYHNSGMFPFVNIFCDEPGDCGLGPVTRGEYVRQICGFAQSGGCEMLLAAYIAVGWRTAGISRPFSIPEE